jgi:hypothetical protein
MNVSETKKKKRKRGSRAIWGGLAFFGLYAVAWAVILRYQTDAHSASDIYAGVDAFFSGAAFGGVILAIILQMEELSLQRKELRDTRKVLKDQNETFTKQKFDSAFFQMLNLHHEIVKGMDVPWQGKIWTGRDCFMIFIEAIKRKLETEKFVKQKTTSAWERPAMEMAYLEVYEGYQGDIGHYFRNLYNIVKFVDRSDVKDKKFYTNLIRAQLSSNELLLLFYNCASPPGRERDGKEKFRPLVEKYALLKNMPEKDLIDPSHKGWYEAAAYGVNA